MTDDQLNTCLTDWLISQTTDFPNDWFPVIDLAGRMQSTDTIYKHRIQVAHDESSTVPITPVATPQQPHSFSDADIKNKQPETVENGQIAAAED